jgi:hypothetical protein
MKVSSYSKLEPQMWRGLKVHEITAASIAAYFGIGYTKG